MEIVSVIPVVINTSWTQPIDYDGGVVLVPPGSIKVSGDGDKLYAVRITTSNQTVSLDGTVKSKGAGTYTCGLLFQNDLLLDQDGYVQFYTGKAKVEVIGNDIATGISGGDLTLVGRANTPLTGLLKVEASSDAAAPMASGIFAESIDVQAELAMRVTVRTDAENEFGYASAYGMFGGNNRFDDFSDKFRLTAQAASGMNADAYGIAGETTIDGALAGKIVVQAEGLYGDSANAYGFYGSVATQSVSSKFKLEVESRSKTGSVGAYGFAGDFAADELLTGTVIVKARTTEGLFSIAGGFGSVSDVAGVSDQFELNVQAKGGWSQAIAYGVAGAFSTDGTLGGTFKIKADGCNIEPESPAYGTEAYGFSGAVSAQSTSDKFNLDVLAKAQYQSAKAYGFASTLDVDNLGGTVTVKAEAVGEAAAEAYGVAGTLTALTVSDKFTLTVTAKSKAGMAVAQGFAATDIESGLAGKVSVTAESKSGNANAVGGALSSTSTFRTQAGNTFEVIAKAGGVAMTAVASGVTGDTGAIDLGGRLVVIAQGDNAIVYGVKAENALSGSISGVISVVGGEACGVLGGDSSTLEISGGVYAGIKGNATDIARYLENRIGTGRNASGQNKNTDQAVELGEDSTLSLTDGSIVIGDVTLGEDSTLNLSTGAQLYGDIGMNASGELNITVDGMLSKAAMVTLSSGDAGIFSLGSGVNLSVTATDVSQTGSYVLLAGSNLSELSGVDFNTLFDLIGFDTYGFDVAWDLDLSGKTDTLTLILSQDIGGEPSQPVETTTDLLSATDLNSADRLLASSSFTEDAANSGASFWKNSLIA